MSELNAEMLAERRVVDAVIACLPMSDDGTGHVADCGWTDDEMKCGCVTLPSRIADVIRGALAAEKAAREEAERDAMNVRDYISRTINRAEDWQAKAAAEKARAVKAEQERDAEREVVRRFEADNADETGRRWVSPERYHRMTDRAVAAEARVAELEADRASAERFMEQAEAQVAALIGAAQHPHKGPHDTDASMLREAAKRLRGGYEPGGSNTKQTVANVCDAVAELLARVDAPKPDEPVSIYDPSLYGDRKPDDEKGQARA